MPSTKQRPVQAGRGAAKFSDTEREAILDTVAELDRNGWSQTKIAKHIGVSQPMVHNYLTEIKRRYRETYIDEHRVYAARELAFLMDMRRRAEEALRRTEQQERVKTTEEQSEGGEGGGFSKSKTENEGLKPAAEYMTILLGTSDRIRKLLGLDEAIKLDVSATVGVVDLMTLLAQAAQARGLTQQAALPQGGSDE